MKSKKIIQLELQDKTDQDLQQQLWEYWQSTMRVFSILVRQIFTQPFRSVSLSEQTKTIRVR